MFNQKLKSMEKKLFVAKKMDFGTKAMCEARLKKISAAFQDERLQTFGLIRDAKTFDDFTRGGTKSIAQYRASLEAELNVNSKIPFLARKAQAELDEGIEELKTFIREVTNFMPCSQNSHDMGFNAEDIRLDEETGDVVFTKVGNDKLDSMLNIYLTKQKQVDIWNVATDIKEKVERLNKMLTENNNGIPCYFSKVLRVADSGVVINAEAIAAL